MNAQIGRGSMDGSRLDQQLFAAELGQALFTSSPDGILLVDENGIIRMLNTQAELMFGWTRSELIGQPVEVLVPPDQAEQHRDNRAFYVEDPKPRSMGVDLQLVARRKTGSDVPVEISLGPVVTDRGLFTAVTVRRARFGRPPPPTPTLPAA